MGRHEIMDSKRRAQSTERNGREQSEERTNEESRRRRSRHCGTIHHRVTEAPKGAQYGAPKIPLSAKTTNDAFGRISRTSCLSRDTPIPHGRLF
ncbi:hypothetical protein CDL15_Pgr003946 [Punica granatum]|uniref:Uncharacterized protein n=1 Tax=Punica granatum TaxID=22663 RepID=A0A218XMJ0_PUNGR|nr:hypothetical protein CDL15_Pgr003946 [Punica granatum]